MSKPIVGLEETIRSHLKRLIGLGDEQNCLVSDRLINVVVRSSTEVSYSWQWKSTQGSGHAPRDARAAQSSDRDATFVREARLAAENKAATASMGVAYDSTAWNEGLKSRFSSESQCTSCKNGKIQCNNCDSLGKTRCSWCSGRGEVSCSGCSGTGVVVGSDNMSTSTDSSQRERIKLNNPQAICVNCAGKGKKSCSSCWGSGRVNCSSCHGTKKVNCSTCKGTCIIHMLFSASIKGIIKNTLNLQGPADINATLLTDLFTSDELSSRLSKATATRKSGNSTVCSDREISIQTYSWQLSRGRQSKMDLIIGISRWRSIGFADALFADQRRLAFYQPIKTPEDFIRARGVMPLLEVFVSKKEQGHKAFRLFVEKAISPELSKECVSAVKAALASLSKNWRKKAQIYASLVASIISSSMAITQRLGLLPITITQELCYVFAIFIVCAIGGELWLRAWSRKKFVSLIS